MTDRETLDRARLLFVGDTQGDKLAREVIAIAERAIQKAAEWERDFAVLSTRVDELTSELLSTGLLLQESQAFISTIMQAEKVKPRK
jgi:hypothetical protein